MPICSRCGNEIEFRYIDGRCVPLHPYGGGCSGSARSDVYDYAGYSRSKESSCFLTNCPECGDDVYFIRHNGGSVWIDPPLGPPWYKHPCMDNTYVATIGIRSSVLADSDNLRFSQRDGLIIGIVKEAEASSSKRCSLINIETGKNLNIILLMKNNAGFLVGRLVLYDQRGKSVWWIENDIYTFRVIARLRPKPIRPDTLARQVECPECSNKLPFGDMSEHLTRDHWFPRTMALDKPVDRLPVPKHRGGLRRSAKTKICPNPSRWDGVFKQLLEYAETHPCSPGRPPTPLILSGWALSNDVEKMHRWKETVSWATANGCAAIVEAISEQDFHRVEKPTSYSVGPMGGPCYQPWDFNAKVRPLEAELAKHLEYLSIHWDHIAGSGLSKITRPLTFTGKKRRRLLVQAEGASTPPWGGWSFRLPDEKPRRTFTQFRSAINSAIAPHEVDHIAFVAEQVASA